METPIIIPLESGGTVDGLAMEPPDAWCCYVFAHGAGAGMGHAFMSAFASGLATRGIATLRYQFPFMQAGSKRPDRPAVAHAAVRAACAAAAMRLPGLPLLAGGKSFGGRMTSQAQALEPLDSVRGLVFVGFPLHPAGQPADERAAHLADVALPMLFLQGTRDELAALDKLEPVVRSLGPRATLVLYQAADHAFHVRAADVRDHGARNDRQVMEAMQDALAEWARGLCGTG